MTVARVAAGTLSLALLGGFAATASRIRRWVSQPEGGASPPDAVALAHDDAATPTQSESAPTSGPQRLDHTVTLGSVMVADAAPAPAAPGSGPTSVVIVNVNGYGGPAYAPYGYGYGYGLGTSFSRAGGGGENHPAFPKRHVLDAARPKLARRREPRPLLPVPTQPRVALGNQALAR